MLGVSKIILTLYIKYYEFEQFFLKLPKNLKLSMECSLMVNAAALCPGDPGSNPGWFAVLNTNQNLFFMNNTIMKHSSKYLDTSMEAYLINIYI